MNSHLASIEPHGKGFRVVFFQRGVRRRLWLGPCSKGTAQAIAAHIDLLRNNAELGIRYENAPAYRWASGCGPRIKKQLAAWGLIEQATPRVQQLSSQLGPFLEGYLASRDDLSQRSRKRYTNAANKLIAEFGRSVALSQITPGDCDRFARAMNAAHKPSHAGKIIRDARHFLKVAERDRLIEDNPFSGIQTSHAHDKTREAHITRDAALLLIEKAPNAHYRALIAAARFCGLRVPSEPLELRIEDCDFERERITITSPKTKASKPTRVIPIFPEFRPYLTELIESLPDGSEYVFQSARQSAAKTWRAGLLGIVEKAKLKPWPKLWMNLRASCRTDLLEHYPEHVVSYWLGHSSAIGRKHYDRIPDEMYAKATRHPSGAALGAVPGAVGKSQRVTTGTDQN